MNYQLTCFEMWILQRIFKRAVIQSEHHAKNIELIYGAVREAAEKEFTEDNTPTIDDFLRERFEATQKMTPDLRTLK